MKSHVVANIIEDSRFAGPQKRILNVARYNFKTTFTTIVYLPKSEEESFLNALAGSGIAYKTLRLTTLSKNPVTCLKYIFFFPFEIVSLILSFKRQGVDIVHCSGGAWQIKGVIAARFAGIKAIWHINDTNMPTSIRRLFSFIARCSATHIVVAGVKVHEYYGDFISSNLPVSIIPAPVETNYIYPTEKLFPSPGTERRVIRLVSVGHVNPLKGYHNLLRVLKILQSSELKFELVIAGALYESQTSYINSLKSFVESESLQNCRFIGACENIRDLLNTADIYVCSSRYEASPTSVWEAMSAGLAIVSTDVGDVPVYIDHETSGYITPVDDIERMASFILDLALNEEKAKSFGVEARKTAVLKLDLSVVAEKHIDLYQRLTT